MARTPAELGLATAKWRSSGLSDPYARRLGYRYLTSSQVKKLGSAFHEAGAMLIPYHNLAGKRTKFYRIRYLEQLPGAAGLLENAQRYDQPPVTQDAYFPLLKEAGRLWKDIAKDTTCPILITEGELKAACAVERGYPTAALGGVYSFMSSKMGVELIPSLEIFSWEGREVFIIYDNDQHRNPDIIRAECRLADVLTARGAKVWFAHLPPGPMKGLDDFLVAGGDLDKVLAGARSYEEGAALHRMNEDVSFIKSINVVLEKRSGLIMRPGDFTQSAYANRVHVVQVTKGSGKKAVVSLERVQTAKKWLEWEHRGELASLAYEPGGAKIITNSPSAWNTWPGWGVTPKRGTVGPWEWLLDFVFQDDDKTRKYFEQWCAYPIQYPGAKLHVACVLWSRVKRLGKSSVGIALSKLYGQNAMTIDSKDLKGQFNSWAKFKQFVLGEEITAGEARVESDWLKGIITNPGFTVKEKFKPDYTIRNCMNFLFLSNHPDAIFLEDGDERYLVHNVKQDQPADAKYYERFYKWLNGEGPRFLMRHLLDLPLRGFDPAGHAPKTASKYDMTYLSKTDVSLLVQRLGETPGIALRQLGRRLAESCDLFTPEELFRALCQGDRKFSLVGMGKALAAAGYRQVNDGTPVVTGTGAHRLYAVRNQVRWERAARKEIRKHYDEFHNPRVSGEVK